MNKPEGQKCLGNEKSWKKFCIVHYTSIFHAAVWLLCPGELDQQRQQTDSRVKYYLLQIIHTFHTHRQLQQVQSWTCLQIRVRTRLSCQSWFLSLSLSHIHSETWAHSFSASLVQSVNHTALWKRDNPGCRRAVKQSGGLVEGNGKNENWSRKCTWHINSTSSIPWMLH